MTEPVRIVNPFNEQVLSAESCEEIHSEFSLPPFVGDLDDHSDHQNKGNNQTPRTTRNQKHTVIHLLNSFQ